MAEKRNEDSYQPLSFYEDNTSSTDDGFERFEGPDGEHYFVYRDDGRIILLSEGYPTTAARDKGVASVTKNIPIESRYQFEKGGLNGRPGFALRAGNHKEIARSVPFSSSSVASSAARALMGQTRREDSDGVTPAAAGGTAAVMASSATADAVQTGRDKPNTYLPEDQYAAYPKSADDPRIARFTHDDGYHYFAVYDEEGRLAWRSGGRKSIAARDEDLALTLAQTDGSSAVKRLERGDRYVDVVYDGEREVARSPLRTRAKAADLPKPAALAPLMDGDDISVVGEPMPAAPVAPPATPVSASAKPRRAPAPRQGLDDKSAWHWLKWVLLILFFILAALVLAYCFVQQDDGGAQPVTTAIACSDGTFARTLAECPVDDNTVDTSDTPSANDGAIAPQNTLELAPPTRVADFECWDGSLVFIREECPPDTRITCPDGTLALTLNACTPVETSVAADAQDAAPETTTRSGVGFPWFAPAPGSTPQRVDNLLAFQEFGDARALTPAQFRRQLSARYDSDRFDRAYLNALYQALGFTAGFNDPNVPAFSNARIPTRTDGLLGYGGQHGIEHVRLRDMSDTDRDAFALTGPSGRTIYFLKRTGSYFYPL